MKDFAASFILRNRKLCFVQADDLKTKITKLEKSVDEVSGKLKAEEAKRRELENKNKILESKASAVVKTSEKIATNVEEKPKTVRHNFLLCNTVV